MKYTVKYVVYYETQDDCMKAVTFFAPYGGAGRTTAAMAIASANVEMERRVHIFEVVDQLPSEVRNLGEYSSWAKATCTSPDQYLPRVEQIGHEADLAARLVDLGKEGIDLVLIDTPPWESVISNAALEVSDLVVVPISKSISEITGKGWLSDLSEKATRVVGLATGFLDGSKEMDLIVRNSGLRVLKNDLPYSELFKRQKRDGSVFGMDLAGGAKSACSVTKLSNYLDASEACLACEAVAIQLEMLVFGDELNDDFFISEVAARHGDKAHILASR